MMYKTTLLALVDVSNNSVLTFIVSYRYNQPHIRSWSFSQAVSILFWVRLSKLKNVCAVIWYVCAFFYTEFMASAFAGGVQTGSLNYRPIRFETQIRKHTHFHLDCLSNTNRQISVKQCIMQVM